MKKETMEYLNGERNVTQDEFIIGREKSGKAEYIIISIPGDKKPIYTLWNSKKHKKSFTVKKQDDDIEIEKAKAKGTGGKKPYTMMMLEQIEKLYKSGLSNDGAGFLLCFNRFIEWNTGRLYDKHTKKALSAKDISKYTNTGIVKTRSILKELTTLNVLAYDKAQKSYFINRNVIKKGAYIE